jgi:hypothetical protein
MHRGADLAPGLVAAPRASNPRATRRLDRFLLRVGGAIGLDRAVGTAGYRRWVHRIAAIGNGVNACTLLGLSERLESPAGASALGEEGGPRHQDRGVARAIAPGRAPMRQRGGQALDGPEAAGPDWTGGWAIWLRGRRTRPAFGPARGCRDGGRTPPWAQPRPPGSALGLAHAQGLPTTGGLLRAEAMATGRVEPKDVDSRLERCQVHTDAAAMLAEGLPVG